MKVHYEIKTPAEIKDIKEILKPFGGRCAKLVEGTLEYQIKEEYQTDAYHSLKEKGIVE